jgi:hypothetical protein
MDNKVGDHVPAQPQVKSFVSAVQAIRDDVEKFTIKLSPAEKRHLAALPPGGEAVVQHVGVLAEKYGLALSDMPVDGMRDDLTLAQRLAPLVSEVALLLEILEDTVAQARSEAWQAATGNYSVLARVSAANPALAKELAPAREFFVRRRSRKAAPKGNGKAAAPEGNGTP